MAQDVFQAIADPTRRGIIDLLAEQSLPVNSIAEQFDISRPAVSKHIKILNECGLIVIRKKGRRRYCRTDPRKLEKVAEWTGRYQKFWSKRLNILDDLLDEEDKKRKKNPKD